MSRKGFLLLTIILTLSLITKIVAISSDRTITLSAGLTLEPYVIGSNNSGIEIDIVREALAVEGYVVKFVYQPLRRAKITFFSDSVDGVLTVKSHFPEVDKSFLSNEYITYHNFAVSLKSNKFKINNILDLKDKTVDAFQQARLSLGNEFKEVADQNPRYREIANQKNQIKKLFNLRSDVIVLDRRIFKYYRNELKKSEIFNTTLFETPVKFHALFEPTHYRIAFKSKILRDSFNLGLIELKKSGRYKEIIKSYIKD